MDQSLLFLINRQWTAPWLDRAMAVLSSWDFWWPLLLVAGLLIVFAGGFRARAMLLCCGLAILVTDGVVVSGVKKLVGRPRPHMVLEGVRELDLERASPRQRAAFLPLREKLSTPGILPLRGGSFPSGHAANNFCIATVVAVFYRRFGWLCFLPACLVSYSRIYVGSHWPTDIVISALIGASGALLTLALLGFLWSRWGERWFPRIFRNHPELVGK